MHISNDSPVAKASRLFLKKQPYFRAIANNFARKDQFWKTVGVDEILSILQLTVIEHYPRFNKKKGTLKKFLVNRCTNQLQMYQRKHTRRNKIVKIITTDNLDNIQSDHNAVHSEEYHWLNELSQYLTPDGCRVVNMVLWPNKAALRTMKETGEAPRTVRGLLRTYLTSKYVGWTERRVTSAYKNIQDALDRVY